MTVLDDRPPAAPAASHAAAAADGLRLNAAHARLTAAVGELLQPTRVDVARERGTVDVAVDQADDEIEHRERMAKLRKRHADYAKRRDTAGMRRALAVMIEWERAHRAAFDARAAMAAELPSLLDQLVDAVNSRQGHGGGAGGVHRWVYGVDAAMLLAEIDRTVRPDPAKQAPYRPLIPAPAQGLPAPPPRELPRLIRSWAGLAGHWRATRPQRLIDNADLAEAWLARAREVLAPPRRIPIPDAACPRCGATTVHVPSDTGEYVRRWALEVDVETGWARCLNPSCPGRWSHEQLPFLGRLIREQGELDPEPVDR